MLHGARGFNSRDRARNNDERTIQRSRIDVCVRVCGRSFGSVEPRVMVLLGPDTAWMVLAGLWSLNGPVEGILMRTHSGAAYAKAKAIAVGATYLAAPIALEETLAIFTHPLMWLLLLVSIVNTPLNAYIIKHGNAMVQLPLAQVVSQLLRMLWWSVLLKKPLTPKQCVGICAAAVSCACLGGS